MDSQTDSQLDSQRAYLHETQDDYSADCFEVSFGTTDTTVVASPPFLAESHPCPKKAATPRATVAGGEQPGNKCTTSPTSQELSEHRNDTNASPIIHLSFSDDKKAFLDKMSGVWETKGPSNICENSRDAFLEAQCRGPDDAIFDAQKDNKAALLRRYLQDQIGRSKQALLRETGNFGTETVVPLTSSHQDTNDLLLEAQASNGRRGKRNLDEARASQDEKISDCGRRPELLELAAENERLKLQLERRRDRRARWLDIEKHASYEKADRDALVADESIRNRKEESPHQNGLRLEGPFEPASLSEEYEDEEIVACSQAAFSAGTESPSESLAHTPSETTETDTAGTILDIGPVRHVTDTLLRVFGRYIQLKLNDTTVRKCGGTIHSGNGTNSTPSSNQDYSQLSSDSRSHDSQGPSKRGRGAYDDDDESGEPPQEGGPSAKRPKAGCLDKQKIACPFMKRFPAAFATWRTCVGPGFDGMNRMKEHLKRRHFKEHCCQRCGIQFDSNRALQGHLRLLEPCSLHDVEPERGFMTQVQWEDINRKRQGHRVPLIDRWKEIYLLLFPDADEVSIPSPYFDSAECQSTMTAVFDIAGYEAYLKQHLPGRILVKLTQEFEIMSVQARQKLASIVQEESLSLLKAYGSQRDGSRQNCQDGASLRSLEHVMSGNTSVGIYEGFGGLGPLHWSFSFPEESGWPSTHDDEPQLTDSGHVSAYQ